MPRYIFVGDIVEGNGKTWKENNLVISHNIPIGTLVELESGVRLFVAEHDRDCDGTPLYSLSFYKRTVYPTDTLSRMHMCMTGGYSENSLTIVP